jgi:hypothetical protein
VNRLSRLPRLRRRFNRKNCGDHHRPSVSAFAADLLRLFVRRPKQLGIPSAHRGRCSATERPPHPLLSQRQTLRISSRLYVTYYVGEVSVPQFASELSSLKCIGELPTFFHRHFTSNQSRNHGFLTARNTTDSSAGALPARCGGAHVQCLPKHRGRPRRLETNANMAAA